MFEVHTKVITLTISTFVTMTFISCHKNDDRTFFLGTKEKLLLDELEIERRTRLAAEAENEEVGVVQGNPIAVSNFRCA